MNSRNTFKVGEHSKQTTILDYEDRPDTSYFVIAGVFILGVFSNTNEKLETCPDISFTSDAIPGSTL